VFLLADQNGTLRYASPSVQRVLGYHPGDLLERSLLTLVHPQDRVAIQATLLHSESQEGAVTTHELQLHQADGSWHLIEATMHYLTRNPAVGGIVITARDITQRKQAEHALHRLAFYDPLTGLPNRALLQDRLQEALADAVGDNGAFALAVLDLDRFKEVNDALGHPVGDALLREVGWRLQQQARSTDTIARLGGDEFALLLPAAHDETLAREMVRHFLVALEAPFSIDGATIGVGASVGVTLYGAHGTDAATLLRCADIAMYAAKRNQLGLAVYAADQNTASSDELGMYAELRTAITTGELVLYYQPKIALASAEPVGVEALVRWQHSQRGLVAPDRFIPLAERSGLMPALTRWVTGTALQQMRLWHQQGIRLSVSVNLSASALNDLELAQEIVRLVSLYGVSAHHLVVEVTESAIMRDFDQARAALDCLRAAGIRVSVDDFGTGQSSLAYLKALSLDELKIDRGFVKDMLTEPQDEAIVRSVIELGHRLGLQVVAEGVEEPAAYEALKRFGCDLAQGYWMGRPLPEKDLRNWFAQWDVVRTTHTALAHLPERLDRAA
jgi:diguanylate cyclase (GGDEF)-like protein/PAS domain S-box-containing protein